MPAPTTLTAPGRKGRHPVANPAESGLPDPRPLTEYTVTLTTVGGHSRLTVTLSQPCVIRHPLWALIDCSDASLVTPTSVTVVSNTSFFLDYAVAVGEAVAFVQVPYQDMQVQNFQGGFVRPGGQWFRKPT